MFDSLPKQTPQFQRKRVAGPGAEGGDEWASALVAESVIALAVIIAVSRH